MANIKELEVKIKAQGHLKYVVAPNFFHHLYIRPYAEKFPNTQLYYAPRLKPKIKDRISLYHDVLPLSTVNMPWESVLATSELPGMPTLNEFQFFHRQDRVLITTDTFFNFQNDDQLGLKAKLVGKLLGVKFGKPARSLLMKIATKDKSALKTYLYSLKELKPQIIICAHGEIVSEHTIDVLDNLISSI